MTTFSPLCILCKKEIGTDTTPEHILLNALGGRMTVRDVICSSCNHDFGNGPDADLAGSVGSIRTITNLVAGDGDAAPKMIGLEADGERFDVLPGMSVRMRPVEPLKVEFSDNEISVQIGAYSEEKFGQLVEGAARSIAKKLGDTRPEVVAAIKADLLKDRKSSIRPAPTIHSQFRFGAGRSQQAMAKACLVLLAKRVGPNELQHSRYDLPRSFALSSDISTFQPSIALIDTRPFPLLDSKFGPIPNLIWVGTNERGEAYGYYRLYGAIGWRFKLCDVGAPASVFGCLISDPLNNSVWAYIDTGDSPLRFEWVTDELDRCSPDLSAGKKSVEKVVALAQQRSREATLTQWAFEALQEAGLEEGALITEETMEAIVNYIEPRIVAAGLKVEVYDKD